MNLLRALARAGLFRPLRAGFTLLEMLVVIMIIGILSTYLVVNVPEWLDNAKVTASRENLRRIYSFLLQYQADHDGAWPKAQGQRFFLQIWKDGYVEHTDRNARMFFSPVDVGLYPPEEGQTLEEYLDDWEAIGPGYTSYAGFNSQGDPELRRSLLKHPGKTTILSDARMVHRNKILFLTADGQVHQLLKADVEEKYGIDLDEEDFVPGPGCVIEELRTVTND